jgi:hypothetical protein
MAPLKFLRKIRLIRPVSLPTALGLDVDLIAQSGKAVVHITTADNEVYINLTTLEGILDALKAIPNQAVLKPLLLNSQWIGLSETVCHLQLKQMTFISFQLSQFPLNVKELVSQSLSRFIP